MLGEFLPLLGFLLPPLGNIRVELVHVSALGLADEWHYFLFAFLAFAKFLSLVWRISSSLFLFAVAPALGKNLCRGSCMTAAFLWADRRDKRLESSICF